MSAERNTNDARRGFLGRLGRNKAAAPAESWGSDWIDSRFTVDRSTASAALSELTDLAGTITVREDPDLEVRHEPDEVVVIPETPVYDPRMRGSRALRPVPDAEPARIAPTTRKRTGHTIRPTPARRAYGPGEKPPEPEAARGELEPLDDRTAAWFNALVPSAQIGDETKLVEVRDGAGQKVDQAPTLETLANLLLDIAPKTESESFKGLHIVLESEGRRMELNIE